MQELSNLPIVNFSSVQFFPIGKISHELGKVTATSTGIYNISDKTADTAGVASTFMGTIDNVPCKTCANIGSACLGHSGLIKMPDSCTLISPLMITLVHKYLRIICHKCYKPLNDKVSLKHTPTTDASRKCKNPGCGNINQPAIATTQTPMVFIFKYPSGDTTSMYPNDYRHILESITEESLARLGVASMAHPRHFILDKIVMTSIVTRPTVKIPGKDSQANMSDFTWYYSKIMTTVADINESQDPIKRDKLYKQLIALTYNTICKNDSKKTDLNITISSSPFSRTNTKALMQQLSRKTGRLRGNTLGKTVCEIGRAVIISNSSIKPTEIVIPIAIAKILTRYIYVQDYNINVANMYIQNALNGKYPMATLIIRANGQLVSVVPTLKNVTIAAGDIVARNLISGDPVMINRMPTLNTGSINCHFAIVNPDPNSKTIEIQALAASIYNADFDGDSMSVVNVVRPSAEIEAVLMMRLANQFISFVHGATQFMHIQDEIIGGSLMTWANTNPDKPERIANRYNEDGHILFSKRDVMFLTSNNSILPKLHLDPKDKMYTGYDIMSYVLPNNINVTSSTKVYNEAFKPFIQYGPTASHIKIVNGQMVSGVHDKSAGVIYRAINTEYGPDAAMDILFNVQQITMRVPSITGFSVGMGDLIQPLEMKLAVNREIHTQLLASYDISERLLRSHISAPIGKTIEAYVEDLQRGVLASDYKTSIMRHIDFNTNAFIQDTLTEASGTYMNIQFIFGAYGQTTVLGHRIAQTMSYKRTDPYSTRFSLAPESRGYIGSGVIGGVTAAGFAHMAKSARNDIVDKSQNIAIVGYQSRIAVFNMNDTTINNKGMCETDANLIVQLVYGEDGFDPRFIEKVKLVTLMMSDEELDKNYADIELEQIKLDRDFMRNVMLRSEMRDDISLSDTINLPINVERVVNNAFISNMVKEVVATDDELELMRKLVLTFTDDLKYIYYNDVQKNAKAYVPPYIENALRYVIITITYTLCIKMLKRMNMSLLQLTLKLIELRLRQGLMHYGTSIGIMTALAISAPLSQLTLNAIHKANSIGGKSTDFNSMNEVLKVYPVEKCRNPMMYMALKDGLTLTEANMIANRIELLSLNMFVDGYQIFVEEFAKPTHSKYTKDKTAIDEMLASLFTQPSGTFLKWCLRFTLNLTEIILKNVTVMDIVNALSNQNIYILYSDENEPNGNIFIRIYFKNVSTFSTYEKINEYAASLMVAPIRGVRGVISAKTIIKKETSINSDGSIGSKDRAYIYTNGINILGLMSLQLQIPEIDYTTVQCDNINETEIIFGIAAAKLKIITECGTIFGSANLDYRHYSFTSDIMTYTGTTIGIKPAGPRTRNSNILLQIANESPVKAIERSVGEAKKAKISGIVPSLMSGTIPNMGTSYNKVIINEAFLQEQLKE